MRYKYRITKYNPANRTDAGAYLLDDWISYSDIGKAFAGRRLTRKQYLQIENSYLFAIDSFLRESGVKELFVSQLENKWNYLCDFPLYDGVSLNLEQINTFSRAALREQVWAKLIFPRRAYVHFGYDYYLYVGVARKCPVSIAQTTERGLFVESFTSPHK
jgi:hypothetical protein